MASSPLPALVRGARLLVLCSLASCALVMSFDYDVSNEADLPDAEPLPDANEATLPTEDVAVDTDAKFSKYRNAVLADKPLAYWRMGIQQGSSLIKDETGNGNDLVLQGGGHTFGRAGALAGDDDTALGFDGKGSRAVLIGDARAFDFPNRAPFTIECWAFRETVRPDGGGGFSE